ncbi:MAG: hypothetical protein FWG74_07710 [Planctomycetes bacterium]|nr:hypothetical protein [Planctomycetota bacterium]
MRWATEQAAPGRMVRRLAAFIADDGRRRKLRGIFIRAHDHLKNEEPPHKLVGALLFEIASEIGELFTIPANLNDEELGTLAKKLFEEFHGGKDAMQILTELFDRPHAMTEADNDLNFFASIAFLGLDCGLVKERAGILEYDAGLDRDEAARQAFILTSKLGADIANVVFDCSTSVFDAEIANGWNRRQTIDILTERVRLHERTRLSRSDHRDKTLEAG